MSRLVIFICLVMLATAVVSADPPAPSGAAKGPSTDLPKVPDAPKTDLPKTPDAKGFPDLGGKN